ncbi:MAG TPA: hypothetical protein VNC78_08985, partial [Actinomycetota bacterium]|nr:hypothetical protein [Actinomycetota bacterium]
MLGAASGVFLAVVPPSVPEGRFSSPLAAGGFIAIQVWFAIQHVGLLIGIQALARFGVGGASRLTRIGHWLAGAGMLGLAIMEVVAITAADAAYPSPTTDPLEAGYGVTSIAIGVGLVLVGIGVLRERRWTGWQRWVPMLLGVWVFVPMTPALMGPFVLARLAITAWMVQFAALGLALIRSAASFEPERARKTAIA